MEEKKPLDRAKFPRTVLAGPYGHPFHPILITIPIGAWTSSVVFDIVGLFAEDPTPFALGSQVLVAIGVVGAVLAAIFGLLDLTVIARGTPARRVALTHMTLNLVVMVLFTISFLVRVGAGHDEISVTGFILSLVGMALLGASGYLGGKLAYHFGVRVAQETKQAEGYS